MKKIKLIFVSLFALALALSCDDDGGDSKLTLQEGAVPNIEKVESTDPIINLLNVQNGEDFTISFTVEVVRGQVASLDVTGFYVKADDGTAEKVILADDVSTFPLTITMSKQDFIDKFTTVNSDTDFELGDQFLISADLTLKDGTIIKLRNDDGSQHYGQDLANATQSLPPIFVTQVYNVSCPSDLGGTYSVVSSGASTDPGPTPDENPISDYPYTTTLTDNGGGNYTLSDAFGGLYILWYDIYGLDFEVEANITDVCGTLSGSFADPFGSTVIITGTSNDDGTLSIHWENDFGDFGDAIYTKE